MASDDLGHLDGFIVDAAHRPRYIVVEPRGLFARRRYLVLATHVRVDKTAGALTVDLDTEVAARYPPFDPDAFERMDEDEWRGYEQSVLVSFPPAAPEEGREPGLSDDAPDWLLSGSWTTVTHERAERLPEEARAYVNEFDPTSAAQGGERPERERMIARESGENEGEPKPDR